MSSSKMNDPNFMPIQVGLCRGGDGQCRVEGKALALGHDAQDFFPVGFELFGADTGDALQGV